jgi:hypothetical protein
MPSKFVIFSTELGPMLDPQNEITKPTTMVVLDRDPIATGKYDPYAGSIMRGSVIPTLGGVVVQDFGVQIKDQRIVFSDEAAISKTTVDDLITLEATTSGEYYFTDGYDCWLVMFSRPQGFIYRRNLISSYFNVARFDYEISLVVMDHENV